MQRAFLLCFYSVAANAAKTFSFASVQPNGNAAGRSLLTLDSNRDGRVTESELAAFAVSQGLNANSVSQEFSSLDVNADGTLDAAELTGAIDGGAPLEPAVEQGVEKQQAASVSQTPLSLSPPVNLYQPQPAAQSAFLENRNAVQKAATDVVNLLALEAREEKLAQALDDHAVELRANSTALARITMERALAAASNVAMVKATQLLSSLTQLENQAQNNEVQAAELRAGAHADVAEADEFMAVANLGLKR